MVASHVAIPAMTIDVAVGLEREMGEPRITMRARNASPIVSSMMIINVRTAQRLIGDLQAILARAEQGDAHG